ncbi:hypothetical protein JOD64_004432 [Micromonospora luteifusca]|uniref:Uncharacterized protein n=1 Tax=Micromonospora luteifusca TaxID=709860 RepID=A0ABS2LYC7_9ACTN|nr:hypothetical protein [Micromonospora luteifusca]MBM7493210.1 hypothetical protein [Micromonospora luteifusca]
MDPDHPDGTDYRVIVRHGDPAARDLHEKIGFADGWGSVTAQLAGVAESQGAPSGPPSPRSQLAGRIPAPAEWFRGPGHLR